MRERLLEAALLPAAIPGGFLRRTVEAAQGMRDSVVSGITLPQDVRAGRVDLGSEEATRRVLDMATLGMTGGFAGVTTRAGETALGSGPVRVGAQALERRGLTVPRGEIGGSPTGMRSRSEYGASSARKAQVDSENQVADRLAAQGYEVVQNPTHGAAPIVTREQLAARGLDPDKNPDLLVNGRVFDTYTPVVDNVGSIRSGIFDKVVIDRQTDRVMLDLRGTKQTDAQVRAALRADPVPGLKEVITLTDIGLGRAFP